MDDDEVFALLAAVAGAINVLFRGFRLLGVRRADGRLRAALAIVFVACAVGLFVVLRTAAARDVVADGRYQLLFAALGIAFVGAAIKSAELLGVSLRHDAIERRNAAAAIAIGGAAVGLTIAYAGANVGEGATIWTTIGPAALAIVALLLAWFVIELLGHASEAITIDRDVAAGVRLAGALVAIAATLGRSVAGDFVSVDATLHDFVHLAWPALAIAFVAGVVDRVLRPTFPSSTVTRGIVPVLGYLVAAGAFAWR